jgi:predicted RNase H-like nuclease (RuvC/YqgF family)
MHFSAQKDLMSGKIKDIKPFIQNGLRRTGNERASPDEEVQKLKVAPNEWAGEQEKLKQSVANSKESTEWASEREKLKQDAADSRAEADKLRSELQQNRSEYGSLRSHLQVQENVTPGRIKKELDDLNRQIEELGLAVSDHLIDAYAEAGATSLKAVRLPELKEMFDHVKGKSSLVESSAGIGMKAPDFFDYAIRAILCRQLCKHIFDPFHPAEPHPANDIIQKVYRRIQRQGKLMLRQFADSR